MRLNNYISEMTKQEKDEKAALVAKYKGVDVKDIPTEDLWVAIASGNKKLAKNVKIFNLPAGKSCPNSAQCYKNCYAKKAEYLYPSARDARARNFRLAKENTNLLKGHILRELKDGDVVRIHESGDMFSQEYLDMWADIVKARPNILFYTYTKTEGMWDWSKIKALPNFNLVSSMINGKPNFGPEEEINITAKELGLPICPCRPHDKVKVCGTTCKLCYTEPQVLFVKH